MEVLRRVPKLREYTMDELVLGQPADRLTDLAAVARKERARAGCH